MDKFTKSILVVIAVGIIGINIQMMNSVGGFFTKAHADSNVQKVVICDRFGFSCAEVIGPSLSVTD
tara:strand:- start:1052 stop:1249 length:198 start_codon:yes stop_codon:yes gene_type:complete